MELQAASYNTLIIGLVVFFVTHLEISIYETREFLIKRLGANGYKGVHSLFAIGGMVLIVMGFMDRPIEIVWQPPEWAYMAPIVAMPFVFMLFAGPAAKNDMARITRHPMLWGIVLFGAAHLLANPDKASVMLFGSFLVYGLVTPWLADRKKRMMDPEGFAAEAEITSVIPFLALAQGRAGPADKGFMKIVIAGLVVYVVVFFLHQYFTGVALSI